MQEIPPLIIDYIDGESLVVPRTYTKEHSSAVFRICMDSLQYRADIKNPYPVHIGGVENVNMLKIEAARLGLSMQYLKSSGEYGIIE